MTSTPLGVAFGLIAWVALSLLLALAWSRGKCALRNKRRRDAAEQRAANVAKRIALRWCPCGRHVIQQRRVERLPGKDALDREMDEFLTDPENYRRQK